MIIRVEFSGQVENESLRADVADIMTDIIDVAGKVAEESNIEDWAEWMVDVVETLKRFQDIFNPNTRVSVDLDPTTRL